MDQMMVAMKSKESLRSGAVVGVGIIAEARYGSEADQTIP
jgi:hypothetical protein